MKKLLFIAMTASVFAGGTAVPPVVAPIPIDKPCKSCSCGA